MVWPTPNFNSFPVKPVSCPGFNAHGPRREAAAPDMRILDLRPATRLCVPLVRNSAGNSGSFGTF
jgi:hypothetical protein